MRTELNRCLEMSGFYPEGMGGHGRTINELIIFLKFWKYYHGCSEELTYEAIANIKLRDG